MKKSKIITLGLVSLLAASMLIGCGPKSSSVSSEKSSTPPPKKIIVGTGNAYKPYCYLDEKGNPVGFDVEILKELDKRLPQYQFEIQTMEFKELLLSLGANKIDIASHQYAKNPERERDYLFSNESYTSVATTIIVSKERNDINSLQDLFGKNVQVSPGSNDALTLEKFNKENGNKINLIYGALDTATLVKNLEIGKIDAATNFTRNIDSINQSFGDKIKGVGDTLYNAYTYHIYRKDETQLRDDIDKVLKEMKADGTLSKISIDILGKDYTK